jgi:hypothetical protein
VESGRGREARVGSWPDVLVRIWEYPDETSGHPPAQIGRMRQAALCTSVISDRGELQKQVVDASPGTSSSMAIRSPLPATLVGDCKSLQKKSSAEMRGRQHGCTSDGSLECSRRGSGRCAA